MPHTDRQTYAKDGRFPLLGCGSLSLPSSCCFFLLLADLPAFVVVSFDLQAYLKFFPLGDVWGCARTLGGMYMGFVSSLVRDELFEVGGCLGWTPMAIGQFRLGDSRCDPVFEVGVVDSD
jgi:hypothetical protein